ncbi:hypothetical protein AGMMS49921_06820 [Endomicrobiia bacterium]|nr:hypothetical protein AGMMS49921_06820 [Endomicrobiia bacterium]
MTYKKPKLKVFINLNKLWCIGITGFGGKDYVETHIGKNIDRNDESIHIHIIFLDGRKNNEVWFEEHGLKKVTSDLIEKISQHLHFVMLDHARREYEKGEDIDMYKELYGKYSSSPVSRFLCDNKEYAHMSLRIFIQCLKKCFVTKHCK